MELWIILKGMWRSLVKCNTDLFLNLVRKKNVWIGRKFYFCRLILVWIIWRFDQTRDKFCRGLGCVIIWRIFFIGMTAKKYFVTAFFREISFIPLKMKKPEDWCLNVFLLGLSVFSNWIRLDGRMNSHRSFTPNSSFSVVKWKVEEHFAVFP